MSSDLDIWSQTSKWSWLLAAALWSQELRLGEVGPEHWVSTQEPGCSWSPGARPDGAMTPTGTAGQISHPTTSLGSSILQISPLDQTPQMFFLFVLSTGALPHTPCDCLMFLSPISSVASVTLEVLSLSVKKSTAPGWFTGEGEWGDPHTELAYQPGWEVNGSPRSLPRWNPMIG